MYYGTLKVILISSLCSFTVFMSQDVVSSRISLMFLFQISDMRLTSWKLRRKIYQPHIGRTWKTSKSGRAGAMTHRTDVSAQSRKYSDMMMSSNARCAVSNANVVSEHYCFGSWCSCHLYLPKHKKLVIKVLSTYFLCFPRLSSWNIQKLFCVFF